VDGDGKPDLVTGELYNPIISIYKNTSSAGNISFAARQDYQNLENHTQIAMTDFDGDHKMDIALSSFGASFLEILRNQIDELQISYSGSTTFCSGNGLILRSSSPSGNQWYKDGLMIPGAIADTLLVNSSGLYTDTATVNSALLLPDSSVNIIVITSPAKPTISRDANNNLVSSSSTGNQWLNDTSAIPNAMGQILKSPLADGNYRVQVTERGCSSVVSDSFHYSTTGVVVNGNVNIYPNPVSDWLTLSFDFTNAQSVSAELYNLSGEKVLEKKNVVSGDRLNLSAIASGNYILRLVNTNSNAVLYTLHIIKQ
jgi:hypothetical protein